MIRILNFQINSRYGSQARVEENGKVTIYRPHQPYYGDIKGVYACEVGETVFTSGDNGKFKIVVAYPVPTVKVGDEIEVVFRFEGGKWVGLADSRTMAYEVSTSEKPYVGKWPSSVRPPKWVVRVSKLGHFGTIKGKVARELQGDLVSEIKSRRGKKRVVTT
jgi:hypothetical protein